LVFFPVHPRKVLITNGLFCKVLRINDLGELLCFRHSGAWLLRGCLAPTPYGPSAGSGQAVGCILPPLRGCGGFLICCQRAKCRFDCYFYFIVVCQGKNRSSQSPPTFPMADNPTGTRKSHLRRARMSNSGLSNRRVRSLPKKMTLSAQPHFLTVQSPEERFKPLDQV